MENEKTTPGRGNLLDREDEGFDDHDDDSDEGFDDDDSDEEDSHCDSEEDANDSDSQGESEPSDSTLKFPNPRNLSGLELKRAIRITQHAELLRQSGVISQAKFDGELARAWKLDEGTSPPAKKKQRGRQTKEACSNPVRRSTRTIHQSNDMTASTTTVTPIRRSTRTTKPPETFMASLFSSPNATGANSVDENSVALGPAQTRKRKPNATTSERDDNDVEMAPPPPPIKLCHDPLWSPEEHTQFIEGLRLYADERDATKKWAKIAFHIETKSSQQVRDHAAKPFNSGRWSPEEQSRFRSAVGLYGTADKSDRWKAKVMAIIVQTRNPTQCMQRYRKQLHKEET